MVKFYGKGVAILLMLLCVFCFEGCKLENDAETIDPDLLIYEKCKEANQKMWDENSPMWLALESGNLFEEMVSEEITPGDVHTRLLAYTQKSTVKLFEEQREEFIRQANDLVRTHQNINSELEKIEYSAEIHHSDTKASVYRIVYFSEITQYYKQDFVLEDGRWKITGDNVENKFILK